MHLLYSAFLLIYIRFSQLKTVVERVPKKVQKMFGSFFVKSYLRD